MKKFVAIVLCALLARPAMAADQSATIQERIVEIPQGSIIEVRLLTKEKLRGRLENVSADGFSVVVAKGDQTETRQVTFAEVKSLKRVNKGSTAKAVFAGIGIFYVAVVVIGLIVLAATGKPFND